MKSRPGQGLTVKAKKIRLQQNDHVSRRTQRSPHTRREQHRPSPNPTLAASSTPTIGHTMPLQTPTGIWPVLYAYFDEHNQLDRESMRIQVEQTLAAGAPGIVILGLATEVKRLSRAEREQIVNWAREDIARRVPLAVTVTGDTTEEQTEFGNWAISQGAQWLILQP